MRSTQSVPVGPTHPTQSDSGENPDSFKPRKLVSTTFGATSAFHGLTVFYWDLSCNLRPPEVPSIPAIMLRNHACTPVDLFSAQGLLF